MILTSTELTVPSGVDETKDITIDLAAILVSEIRQGEVAFVTPMKAPELLAEFSKSWRDLHQVVVQLGHEKLQADKAAARRRAVIVLEIAPAKLKLLDIRDSVDTREAVILTDPDFERLQERADKLAAAVEFLKGKLKAFENAFTSVKKVMGEDAYNMQNHNAGNPNAKGDVTSRSSNAAPMRAPTPTQTPPIRQAAQSSPRAGFGRPRYGAGS